MLTEKELYYTWLMEYGEDINSVRSQKHGMAATRPQSSCPLGARSQVGAVQGPESWTRGYKKESALVGTHPTPTWGIRRSSLGGMCEQSLRSEWKLCGPAPGSVTLSMKRAVSVCYGSWSREAFSALRNVTDEMSIFSVPLSPFLLLPRSSHTWDRFQQTWG